MHMRLCICNVIAQPQVARIKLINYGMHAVPVRYYAKFPLLYEACEYLINSKGKTLFLLPAVEDETALRVVCSTSTAQTVFKSVSALKAIVRGVFESVVV